VFGGGSRERCRRVPDEMGKAVFELGPRKLNVSMRRRVEKVACFFNVRLGRVDTQM
jgi:hypothetical protein